VQTTEHWDRIYKDKAATAVSWYEPHLAQSLALVDEAALPANAAILDVGGGASTLAGDLLDRGFTDVTVLDIASQALEVAKAQLGKRAEQIHWLVGDITRVELPAATFDLWHDRAVFHFLTDPADRAAYVRQVVAALKPGGRIIVATFGIQGPDRCSGLPVVRYDENALTDQFGAPFERVHCLEASHTTPWGAQQEFVYCLCKRRE
jgi:SAM-dependent methyltransferase